MIIYIKHYEKWKKDFFDKLMDPLPDKSGRGPKIATIFTVVSAAAIFTFDEIEKSLNLGS